MIQPKLKGLKDLAEHETSSMVLEFLKSVLFSLSNTIENGIAVVKTRGYEGTYCMVACILVKKSADTMKVAKVEIN